MTRRTFSNVCSVSLTLPLERGVLSVQRVNLPNVDHVTINSNGKRVADLTHDEACAIYDALTLMFEPDEAQ